jgi:hypothetical protein
MQASFPKNMSTFATIAICSSIFSIVFSILLTIYSVRTTNLKKPHVKLILVSQICNITLQSGELISFLFYFSDPSNLQRQTILAAFQNYVTAVNLFITGLFAINILSIFSVYDLRLTRSRMVVLKRVWYLSAGIFVLPSVVFFTYLAIMTIDNEDPMYMPYTVVTVGMTWVFLGITMIMGNFVAIYLVFLVISKNNSIEAQQKRKATQLVILNVFCMVLEWGTVIVYSCIYMLYSAGSLVLATANKFSNSAAGIHASLSIVIFYKLQEIALSKAYKRRKAENERQQKARKPEPAELSPVPEELMNLGSESCMATVKL